MFGDLWLTAFIPPLNVTGIVVADRLASRLPSIAINLIVLSPCCKVQVPFLQTFIREPITYCKLPQKCHPSNVPGTSRKSLAVQ